MTPFQTSFYFILNYDNKLPVTFIAFIASRKLIFK